MKNLSNVKSLSITVLAMSYERACFWAGFFTREISKEGGTLTDMSFRRESKRLWQMRIPHLRAKEQSKMGLRKRGPAKRGIPPTFTSERRDHAEGPFAKAKAVRTRDARSCVRVSRSICMT